MELHETVNQYIAESPTHEEACLRLEALVMLGFVRLAQLSGQDQAEALLKRLEEHVGELDAYEKVTLEDFQNEAKTL